LEAFRDAKDHFEARDAVLKQMLQAGLPSPDRVQDWRRQLETLHEKLREALSNLLPLLDEA
jgi:hypothetical protein